MIYSLTLHLKPWWKYFQEVFFSWGQFCSCTRTKHVRRRWKPRPSYRSCHHISKKAALLSAFLTWSQFPSILAQLSDPCPCQQLGVDEAKRKKKGKKRHLKLNLKMCFFWKPGPAAINQGRHFHAPHFSWFLLPSFLAPPWLHSYLLLHWLQTTSSRALRGGRPPFWCLGPKFSPSSKCSPGWPRMALNMEDSQSGQHDFNFLSPPFTNNAQPEKSELMANSNQSGA